MYFVVNLLQSSLQVKITVMVSNLNDWSYAVKVTQVFNIGLLMLCMC